MRLPSYPAAVVSLVLLALAGGMSLARATPMNGLALAAPSVQAAGQGLRHAGPQYVHARRYYHRHGRGYSGRRYSGRRYYGHPYRRAYPYRRSYGRPYYGRPYYGRSYYRSYPRYYYRPRYPNPVYYYPRRIW